MGSLGGITLVHASDFHVRAREADPLSRAYDIRALFLFDVAEVAKDLGLPTALVFSGDIAFKGAVSDYDAARAMFSAILARLGLQEQCILVVPGNHDVDRRKACELSARVLRDQLRSVGDVAADQLFVDRRFDLLAPLEAFQRFAMAYDCLIQGENGYWEVDNEGSSTASHYLTADFPLVIRGVSTVHISDRNDDLMEDLNHLDDGSHMYVARGQLACVPTNPDGPFRILVAHHPPSWWRFSPDRGALANARYHLQLYGHEHRFAPMPAGNAVQLQAGAINPDEADDRPRYNWVNITRQDKDYLVRVWSRVYDNGRHRFVEDPEWPGGRGFLVKQDLLSQPIETEAETVRHEEPVPAAPPPPRAADEIKKERAANPHDVRFALFSQSHARYASVFSSLGYEPSPDQQEMLGGLEYYEEVLEELLKPDQIDRLIDTMRAEGIDVG